MADLIERYKITANLPSVLMNYCNRFNSKQLESITEMIYELENSIESADVQPVKRGHWKDIMMSEATGWDLSLTGGRDAVCETVCSVCGNCCAFGGDGDLYLSPFCPNCGARMIKDGDTNG